MEKETKLCTSKGSPASRVEAIRYQTRRASEPAMTMSSRTVVRPLKGHRHKLERLVEFDSVVIRARFGPTRGHGHPGQSLLCEARPRDVTLIRPKRIKHS